MFIQKSKT